MTRLVALLPMLAALAAAGCDDDDCVSDDARGDTVVSCSVTWGDQPLRFARELIVESGAELTLADVTLALVPAKGGASAVLDLDDGAQLVASSSTLEGPWTLDAEGDATATLAGTRTVGPVLFQMIDQSSLAVTGGQIGELDVRDDAVVTVAKGAWASAARTHDRAHATFDAVTLIEGGAPPSFIAEDASLIVIEDMRATEGTRVYTSGDGRVIIEGGSGWTKDKLRPDPAGTGGITVLP